MLATLVGVVLPNIWSTHFEKSGVRLWGIAATAATGLQTSLGVPPPRWGHHGINSGKKSRMRPSEISLPVENTF